MRSGTGWQYACQPFHLCTCNWLNIMKLNYFHGFGEVVLAMAGELPLTLGRSAEVECDFDGGSLSRWGSNGESSNFQNSRPILLSFLGLPCTCIPVKKAGFTAHLLGQGYECFLPKYKTIRQWSDRKKQMELALFPGYLFCRFDPLVRLPVLKTPGVIQVVGCNRTPVAIEEKRSKQSSGWLNPAFPQSLGPISR